MKRKYDWATIQAFYDEGHTVRECQAEFGFANGAWDSAVGRGEIIPRQDKRPRFRHDTREAVRVRLEAGMSQTEIAVELGLSKGTVCMTRGNAASSRPARREFRLTSCLWRAAPGTGGTFGHESSRPGSRRSAVRTADWMSGWATR